MTVHTIPADHLDAARSGVLVVDGDYLNCQIHDQHPNLNCVPGPPTEFVKLTEPCEACEGRGWSLVEYPNAAGYKPLDCPACDGTGRTWLNVQWYERVGFPEYGWERQWFRAHVLDVMPIVASDDYRVGFDRVKVHPSGEASLFRAKPSDDDLRDITLPPGDHVGRYAVLIEPES